MTMLAHEIPVGAHVTVVYGFAEGTSHTRTGYWHESNKRRGSAGPHLVMNPAAIFEPNVCVWAVSWEHVQGVTARITHNVDFGFSRQEG